MINLSALVKYNSRSQLATTLPCLRPSATSGFTLIELLVAIAIISVLAAIGLPQLNGMYENQKLTNTAHELVTEIKSLQNKALANDQGRFSVSQADGGPIAECTPPPGHPYVDGYRFQVTNATTYTTSYVPRVRVKRGPQKGQICTMPSNTKINTRILPPGIEFVWGGPSINVSYATVSGNMTIGGSPGNHFVIHNTRLPSTANKYYICFDRGRVYTNVEGC